MFRYQLKCSNISRVLNTIDYAISTNLRPYSEGIHFEERNGANISGIMLAENEWDTVKGIAPIRVKFRGKFSGTENDCVLDFWVYPPMYTILALSFATMFQLFTGGPATICIWSCFLAFAIKAYGDLISKTIAEMKKIVE